MEELRYTAEAIITISLPGIATLITESNSHISAIGNHLTKTTYQAHGYTFTDSDKVTINTTDAFAPHSIAGKPLHNRHVMRINGLI